MTAWQGRYAIRMTAHTLATYGTRCHLCGMPGADSADHLTPRSLGGSDQIENLRPAHKLCNSQRGNRPISWWRERYKPTMLHPEQPAQSWEFLGRPTG